MTAPSVEDVVMFAMHDARCSDRCDRTVIGSTFGRVAAAVVAAVRAMTVEQQAELIGGAVEHSGRTHLGDDGLFVHDPVGRVIGPWRAEP